METIATGFTGGPAEESLWAAARSLLHEHVVDWSLDGFEELIEFEEPAVVLRRMPAAIEVRVPDMVWHTAGGERSSRLRRTVPWEGMDDAGLTQAIEAVRLGRKRSMRSCRFCGRKQPPEHRFDHSCCYVCAELHLGVVF